MGKTSYGIYINRQDAHRKRNLDWTAPTLQRSWSSVVKNRIPGYYLKHPCKNEPFQTRPFFGNLLLRVRHQVCELCGDSVWHMDISDAAWSRNRSRAGKCHIVKTFSVFIIQKWQRHPRILTVPEMKRGFGILETCLLGNRFLAKARYCISGLFPFMRCVRLLELVDYLTSEGWIYLTPASALMGFIPAGNHTRRTVHEMLAK